MKKYLAQAAFKSSDSEIKYSMYIGRWQPWHQGHRWLIEHGRVKIITIPDIESINIGRGVGYDIIEHVPPEKIRDVSATNIRKQMKKDGKL